MKRAFPWLVCVLLLVVAQQGALTHAIWHLHAHDVGSAARPAPAHSGQDGHAAGHPADDSPQSGLCGFHLAFGQVLGMAGAPAAACSIAAGCGEPVVDRAVAASAARLSAPGPALS
ncbi:MAG TPA: hypothetical protein VNK67_11765 [Burkholderiales bacterium]|nr:hypothetical protein [Burkholderiales bacterium]